LSRAVVSTPADHKTPPMIEHFAGPARSVLRRFAEDPLGLEAIHAYFSDIYWTKGDTAPDATTLEGQPFPILGQNAARAAALECCRAASSGCSPCGAWIETMRSEQARTVRPLPRRSVD
jgi:hypothetical protein